MGLASLTYLVPDELTGKTGLGWAILPLHQNSPCGLCYRVIKLLSGGSGPQIECFKEQEVEGDSYFYPGNVTVSLVPYSIGLPPGLTWRYEPHFSTGGKARIWLRPKLPAL